MLSRMSLRVLGRRDFTNVARDLASHSSGVRAARLLALVCGMLAGLAITSGGTAFAQVDAPFAKTDRQGAATVRPAVSENRASAVFAGGCFWCVETDFEKLPGVVDVISGYTGGRSQNPTYETYKSGGHREAVFVMYDPTQVTYAGLVEWLIKHIDPTDRGGSFNDRGLQYSPAIYYESSAEKAEAERVIEAIEEMKIYRGRIGVALEPREAFWPAEEYHQNYHAKNGVKYAFFRAQSGRDAFVQSHWGQRAHLLEVPGGVPVAVAQATQDEAQAKKKSWDDFRKPTPVELRKKLSNIQFKVTQQEGTEPAFRNEYWDNKQAGIYVDIVSGEPLFSSSDKFESGTGWPSFVKPLDPKYIIYKQDRGFFVTRIEVRSRVGDSHLGHVFDDGPPARGGKRYCMNSAAMRFIPKEDMEREGYGEFLSDVEPSK